MRRILMAMALLATLPMCAQTGSIWTDGSEWEICYTLPEGDDGATGAGGERIVTYRLRQTDDGYLALEKQVVTDGRPWEPVLQGYLRSEGDSIIYVRPVLADGTIGEECLLYDFSTPFEYGHTIRYGVSGGECREEYVDWQEDSLDYYMLNNGDTHLLPAWKGIVYKYGYLEGPMELFLRHVAPGKGKRPKPSNISHVIFSTKGTRKVLPVDGMEAGEDMVIPYDEMLADGKVWECMPVDAEAHTLMPAYTITMAGDTLIGTRLCKLVYSREHGRRLVVFEEGRKLYVVNRDNVPEVVLDFGVQQGDWVSDVASVLSIQTREDQGYSHRTITIDSGLDCSSYFEGDTEPWNYHLIEGIGVSKDQYLGVHRFLEQEGTFSYLLRCWQHGTLIYQAPGFDSVSGMSSILPSASSWHIYDLHGRRMDTIPHKGIYIIGGRKELNVDDM